MGCKLAVKSVFGYNLQGVVRAVAVYDFVIGALVRSLSWAFALESGELEDVPIFGKWVAILLGVIMPTIRLTSATLLFRLSKSRNARHLRYWVKCQCIVFVAEVAFIPLLWNVPFGFLPKETNLNLGVIIPVFSFVMIFFIVWTLTPIYFAYCFLLELKLCWSLNVTLSKLSDKDVQDLQSNWSAQILQNVEMNEYTISITDLQVDSDITLGRGSFGIVHKGLLRKGSVIQTVAVKSIQSGTNVYYLKTLLEEFVVSVYLGSHENVVQVIGICPEILAQRKLYLVMEYCPFGSLFSLLKCRRALFVSFVENGCWAGPSDYLYASINFCSTINTLNLLNWALNICKGMEFLEEKQVIHGDLASRNVLLDYRKVAKISDFGLAKKLSECSSLVRNDMKLFPWRWMAIESLTDMEFSSKSDVWSFGCTIWEIFSLAEVPFSGLAWDSEFIEGLKSGSLRLQQPSNATHELYDLMLSCWSCVPKSRPEFGKLSTMLKEMMLKYTIRSTVVDICTSEPDTPTT